MRKILAAAVLASAAFGTGTAAAGCWGVEGGKLCYSGRPSVQPSERSICVYTGGDTCEEHYYPWVEAELPYGFYFCTGPSSRPICTTPIDLAR